MADSGLSARLRRIWPALVMMALIASVFWRLLVGAGLSADGGLAAYQPWSDTSLATTPPPANDMLSDQYGFFNANEEFISRWVRRGVWPLWNPDLAHGIPTTASIQNAEYYPTNLLLWPLPPFWTRGVRALLRIGVCLLAMYAFGRTIGMGRGGATLAAISFGFCGFNVVWLGFPVTNVSFLLPGILLTLERTLQRGSFWWGVGLASCAGAALLGGHVPTVLHSSVMIALWLVYRLVVSPNQPAPRLPVAGIAWRLALAALVAACLGSVALLPWSEYLGESPSAVFSFRNSRTLSWKALAVWAVPDFYGSPVDHPANWAARYGLAGWENYCERTGYVGIAGLLLAAVGLVARRPSRVVVPWAIGLLVSGVFIYDPPVLGALLRSLPAFHVVNNSKMISVAAFCLAILAGLGCDVLFEKAGSLRRAWLAAAGTIVALGALLVALWPDDLQWAAIEQAGAGAAFARDCGWALFATLAVLACLAVAPRRRGIALPLLLVVAMLDLWRFAVGFNPIISHREAAPPTAGIRYLQEHVTDGRVLPIGTRLLLGNTLLRFGVPDVRGGDWVNVGHYEFLVTGRTGHYDFGRRLSTLPATLPALNVSHVVLPGGTALGAGTHTVYDGELRIVPLPDGLPRALLVHQVYGVTNDAEARQLIVGGVNLRRVALVSQDMLDAAGTLSDTDASPDDVVRITEARPNDLRLRVETQAPALLVVNDTFFPGWRCEIDGHDVPILRANVAFRAVRVEPGQHDVVFRYRPWRVRVGLLLAVAALLGIATVAIGRRLRAH